MKALGLEQFTGTLTIGAIVMAACAAGVQAFVDLRPFFNQLLSSKEWEVFIAIPVMILSYLIGLIVTKLSSILFDRIRGISLEEKVSQIIHMSKSETRHLENRLLADQYTKLTQELELLQAACPAVGLLSFGVQLKVFAASPGIGGSLPYGRVLFGVFAIFLLLLVPVFVLLASRISQEIKELVAQTASR